MDDQTGPAPLQTGPAPSPGAAGSSAEHDQALLAQVRADLDAVDAALARLEEGTYGRCATCGEPIGDERLAVEPTTLHCAQHAAGPGL
jgi:RNA polymerase-binding transcription factor DksA